MNDKNSVQSKSMVEVLGELANDRRANMHEIAALQQANREIEQRVITALSIEQMFAFLSVNWKKLEKAYLYETDQLERPRRARGER